VLCANACRFRFQEGRDPHLVQVEAERVDGVFEVASAVAEVAAKRDGNAEKGV